MEKLKPVLQSPEVYDFKPKTKGTLKLGRSPRNVELFQLKKANRLATRGSIDFSGKNQTSKKGR